VIFDAAGLRYNAGKQVRILNKLVMEVLGHASLQLIAEAA
jgi:acid phosphatase family membrane protein YuiD